MTKIVEIFPEDDITTEHFIEGLESGFAKAKAKKSTPPAKKPVNKKK
jgi:hypothetical protein